MLSWDRCFNLNHNFFSSFFILITVVYNTVPTDAITLVFLYLIMLEAPGEENSYVQHVERKKFYYVRLKK